METKLTLPMDKQVIEKAKKYVRRKNTSLSRLIRNYLVSLTKTANTAIQCTGKPAYSTEVQSAGESIGGG